MAHIAELGFLAFALAVKAGVGIGDGGVGFVGALLTVKVHFGIAALCPPQAFSWRGGFASLCFGRRLRLPRRNRPRAARFRP